MHKAVRRSTTSTHKRNPELSREESNQRLPTCTSDKKSAKSTERKQDHLIPDAGEPDPIGPTRNYQNAELSPFLPGCPPPGKKLIDSTVSKHN